MKERVIHIKKIRDAFLVSNAIKNMNRQIIDTIKFDLEGLDHPKKRKLVMFIIRRAVEKNNCCIEEWAFMSSRRIQKYQAHAIKLKEKKEHTNER